MQGTPESFSHGLSGTRTDLYEWLRNKFLEGGPYMQVGTWPERRAALEKFQGALQEKFPEMDYNVFVFGSFVRDDFQDGKSDIDMIVYCEDMLKRMEIAEFCSEYFKRRQLEADVLEYYYMEDAYTYAVGILNSIQMTEYYPKNSGMSCT